MSPKLLAALDYRSNNGAHRPLLDALATIRRAEGDGRQYFSADEIAIEDVVRPKWRDIVIEDAPRGGKRVNRINYEICVLQTLRERLRCTSGTRAMGPRRHDLLACRTGIGLHPLAAQALLVLGGCSNDRRRAPARHRDGGRTAVRDSHGQSEVAFAFCRLLGFTLLPRLKAIRVSAAIPARGGQSFVVPKPVLHQVF